MTAADEFPGPSPADAGVLEIGEFTIRSGHEDAFRTADFRGTDRFTRWQAALSPHFAEPPCVEHFADVTA